MLGFIEEPFIKEAFDSRAMSRESFVGAGGLEWTRWWISLAREVASGSSGGTRVSICSEPDIVLWKSRRLHGFIGVGQVKAATQC